MYRDKKQRKEWWNNLSSEQKKAYMAKWERNDKPRIQIPELTQEQIRQINQNMINIGMEKFIVLYEEGEILF